MIFAKCFAIAWMLGWFLSLFRSTVKAVNGGSEPIASFMALFIAWFLVGVIPVLIVKYGWKYL